MMRSRALIDVEAIGLEHQVRLIGGFEIARYTGEARQLAPFGGCVQPVMVACAQYVERGSQMDFQEPVGADRLFARGVAPGDAARRTPSDR